MIINQTGSNGTIDWLEINNLPYIKEKVNLKNIRLTVSGDAKPRPLTIRDNFTPGVGHIAIAEVDGPTGEKIIVTDGKMEIGASGIPSEVAYTYVPGSISYIATKLKEAWTPYLNGFSGSFSAEFELNISNKITYGWKLDVLDGTVSVTGPATVASDTYATTGVTLMVSGFRFTS